MVATQNGDRFGLLRLDPFQDAVAPLGYRWRVPSGWLEGILMIHVIASVEVEKGKRDEFLEVFRGNQPNVLAEDGCVEYSATLDVRTDIAAQVPLREDVVTIVEKWRDLDALQAHLVAHHMLAYRAKLKGVVLRVTLQVLHPA